MINVKNTNAVPDDVVFSLDIGTRNVVGILAKKNDDIYTVIDYEIAEHPERAMFDGQIHDIDRVVKIVSGIVEKLETRHSFGLKKVAIAAAGRALKTNKVTVERRIDETVEISKVEMDSVEMEAVQKAQEGLQVDLDTATKYYCVGYSVINYYLDDGIISNPKGHKGMKLAVELVATFLPHIVVDSLYTVVNKAGLEVINLTLEPIAAINVAIPQNLRLLNLALVDVGAGTSDIAITKDGTIVSYGMVSKAGDKITELLSKEYLLDFKEAERLKISLSESENVSFTDILGMTVDVERSEVVEKVKPAIEIIAKEVAEKILEVNEKSPSAVFCIGGGCQIPTFTETLADFLGIQNQRVVIKTTESLENVIYESDQLQGPEHITPVGIGYTAFSEREKDFLQLTVNDKPIRLFNSRKMTVSDALILIGYNARNLLAARGDAVNITVNGKERRILGEYGEPARIYVNGASSHLDTKLKHKDSIHVEPAVPGREKSISIHEFLDLPRHVEVNGQSTPLIMDITLNDEHCDDETVLRAQDRLNYYEMKKLYDIVYRYEVDIDQFDISINGGKEALDYALKHGDQIAFSEKKRLEKSLIYTPENRDVLGEMNTVEIKDHNDNNEKYTELEDEAITYDYCFTVNGEDVIIEGSNKKLVFIDIFDYIDFDLSTAKGIIDLKLNGIRANYTDVIKSGDSITIAWR